MAAMQQRVSLQLPTRCMQERAKRDAATTVPSAHAASGEQPPRARGGALSFLLSLPPPCAACDLLLAWRDAMGRPLLPLLRPSNGEETQ